MSGNSVGDRIRAKALALGFDAVGFARADVPLEADFDRYEAFVDQGMHGEMRWLADAREARRRLDRDTIQEGARTIICVAKRYQRDDDDDEDDDGIAAKLARYARGRDYHRSLRRRVRQLASFVRTLGARARPMMDEEPVLERAWAVRAGLGFIGKNGLLIIPGVGSMVLLGEVVTTLAIDFPEPEKHAERCGKCTACIDVCPTKAIVRPFVVDPRRCVSYLTIESRTPIPVELREGIGEHLFGCDDCQTVCPFNAGKGRDERLFEPLPRWRTLTLEDLLHADWMEIARGSAVHRATSEGLARNAAIVLGNRKEAPPGLVRAAEEHPSAMVREAAKWALNQAVGTPVQHRAK
jgi:epoxyqueuosine reductase